MNDLNKKENIAIEVEKGQAALRQARILFENDEHDGSVSRAYYAVFHYACAALLTKGLQARSHVGVIRLFNLHFIKNAVFSKRYSTILSHSQKAREESDYQGEIPFAKEDAELRLAEADEFIRHVADFLAREGF